MKLKSGVFLRERISVDNDLWDIMPIGAHSAIRRMQRDNYKTARIEYYYRDGIKTYIVDNPTVFEMLLANVTRTTGKEVVGYRNECTRVEDTQELKDILNKIKSTQDNEMAE